MSEGLISCMWDGRAFVPATPFMCRRAADRFGEGEVVLLDVQNERSMRSHRFYFAQLHDLWSTLPERYATEQWAQSSEHLRRYALIKTGFSDTQTIACASEDEARRWAAVMRPVDEFSIVLSQGTTVVRYTAKSQSTKSMGSAAFAASKTAVLEFVEDLVRGEAA